MHVTLAVESNGIKGVYSKAYSPLSPLPLSNMAHDSTNSLHDNQVPHAQPTNGITPEDLSHMNEFSIDEYRPMKVVVIGAGWGGILAGIRQVLLA